MIKNIIKCNCGALTLTINGKDYSMSTKHFLDNFGRKEDLLITQIVYNCNHCVNHWGVDLCACGSGEAPKDCKKNHSCCGQPSQIIETEQTYFKSQESWC